MSTIILFIVGTCTLLFLAFFVVFFVLLHQKRMFENRATLIQKENAHQKKLMDASLEVAELEREKIAKDVHDDVASVLNVIYKHLNNASLNVEDKTAVKESLSESTALLERAMESIRGIARDLMPPVLIRLGYVNGLEELCSHIKKSNKITIVFVAPDQKIVVCKRVELQLYRMVQEAINNILKHAKPTEIKISLKYDQTGFSTEIFHNGKGINSEMIDRLSKEKGGIGLRSIQSRAQMINATVQYITITEQESLITIEVPIDEIVLFGENTNKK